MNIETISGFNRELRVKDDEFWKSWPRGKPKGYDRFLALAKKGTPRAPWKAPEDVDRNKAQQDFQRGDIERSIAYCREKLGLGRRG
ncbi:MAG: hypothetical protein GWO24_04695 [Akkermansiaceae bacterium]|nr:hypothetical protein [Akkermansiaceae bacterium]